MGLQIGGEVVGGGGELLATQLGGGVGGGSALEVGRGGARIERDRLVRFFRRCRRRSNSRAHQHEAQTRDPHVVAQASSAAGAQQSLERRLLRSLFVKSI